MAANLLLVQNVARVPSVPGPLWSLPFEVQMYVLLPLAWMMARRVRSGIGSLAPIACGFLLWWVESKVARAIGYPPLFTYAPWFSMGIAAYCASLHSRPSFSARLYAPFLCVTVVAPLIAQRLIHSYRAGWAIWGVGIVFAIALPHFKEIASPFARRVAHAIAKYSYGVYLSHVPILWFCFRVLKDQAPWIQWIGCGALLLAVPFALYHLVEAPMIAAGARIAESLCGKREPLAAVTA